MLDIILNERVLLCIYFLVTPTLSLYILIRRANKLFQFTVTISNHVDEIVKKSRKRLYCLSQLKRSGLKPPELIQFYRTCIRPITEYASPVFHDCLPAYLSKDIESIQRRAMRISFPSLSYKEALVEAGLISLSVRRQSLTDKLFTKVTTDRENKLHHLLPEQRTCHYNLRKQRRFKPVFKTNRCKSSFIIHNSQKLFN